MEDRRKVSVKIFGNDYVMIGENSEEYIKGLAEKVDSIMREISKSNYRYNPTMIAILTSLNLADALYKAQEQLATVNEQYENLKGETQKPLFELDNLRLELEAIREQYNAVQKELIKTQVELNKSNKELALIQEREKNLKCELDVSKNNINDLQNTLFESQIELLKARKELDNKKHYGNTKGK